jgi:hypothetical protein
MNGFSAPVQINHSLPIHRAGRMEVQLSYTYDGDFVLRIGQTGVLKRAQPWGQPDVLTPSQACEHEIKVLNYRHDYKGYSNASTCYQLDITHPK